MQYIPIITCIVVIVIVFLLLKKGRRDLPYNSKPLFSAAERAFLEVLDSALDADYRVMGKPRLADLIAVRTDLRAAAKQRAFNVIASKHVDFIVCRAADLTPLVAVELDDRSHEAADRIARDEFVDKALAAAGIPVTRFRARAAYTVDEIAAVLHPLLSRIESDTAKKQAYARQALHRRSTSAASAASAPICPHCAAPLVKRMARRGTSRGKEFYGCQNYPRCSYTQEIADS